MSFSYSKVNMFVDCPYKYSLRHIRHLKARPSVDPASPLYLGTACHTGIETRSVDQAIDNYKSNYKWISPVHEFEIAKLRKVLEKAIEQIPEGEYEVELLDDDGFKGFIDCLVPVSDGVYDILDFKYSNNQRKYKKSGQIHIYKYYFEKLTGNTIRNICYVFIPKISDPTDDVPDIEIVPIPYNQQQVDMFFINKDQMEKATVYEKKPNAFCKSCDYYKFCVSNEEDLTGLIVEEEKPEVQEVSLFG